MRRLAIVLLAGFGCGRPYTYVEPPAHVELEVAPGAASIRWKMGLNAQSTLVVRSPGASAPSPPDGGTVGAAIGNGVVVAFTDGTELLDTSLPELCEPLAWHLWSQAADGTWSKTASTVRSFKGAHTLPPVAVVSNVTASLESELVRLRWVLPDSSTGFEQVAVVRKVGSAPTEATDGFTIYTGPSSMTTDPLSRLSPSSETYYGVFNCNSCGRCGNAGTFVAVPPAVDGGVRLSVSGLSASVGREEIRLNWVSNAPRVKVLRALNRTPTGPFDGNAEVVFDGVGLSTIERVEKLLPDLPLEARVYTYAAWACSGSTCNDSPSLVTVRLTLRQALRGGGYTLFWAHATAGRCADSVNLGNASTTTSPFWWRSCENQCSAATARQLTLPPADDEVSRVRQFVQDSGVTFSRVLSSEYCRAIQTAEGFQFGPAVEQVPALTWFVYDESNRCRDTMALLNAVPAAGSNVAHVGHAVLPVTCPMLDTLEPAEVAIYKPSFGAPPRFIVRVSSGLWGNY